GFAFLARAGGAGAGTAALVLHDDFGYLLGAHVVPAFRRRGAYTALVAARLAFLARRGIGLAVTQARVETSAPILERLGFATVFASRCFLIDPNAS
ncbi:MAG TPA: GNAT family N-acetyltransferase, partial [Minicystis sp.]|nr:GNAT family N-acetyltransferase [Minicystis sp.]